MAALALSVTSAAQAVVVTYQYDELDRLTSAIRSDGPSVAYGYDDVTNLESVVVSGSPDTDGDSIANFADPDDDGDGMPDDWETLYGFDPLDPADGALDPDGDGRSNLVEFETGTNPLIPDSAAVPSLPWVGAVALAALLIMVAFAGLRRTVTLLLVLGFGLSISGNARAELAGWASARFDEGATPAEARLARASRPTTGGTLAARSAALPAPTGPSAAALAASATTELAAIAEALENDPRRIFEFVANEIEYVPYYGALKGAHLAFVEKAGNDFDQAALLVELLRAAGFVANYRFGEATIDYGDPVELQKAADWLGVESDVGLVISTFTNGGIPWLNPLPGIVLVERVWVEVTIDAAIVSLDPAFQRTLSSPPVDLDLATGFGEAAILSAAGGTATTDWVQNLDAAGLDGHLTSLTSQLSTYLQANHATDPIEAVVGGYVLERVDVPALPTALPFPSNPTEPAWTEIPATHVATVRLVYGNIDVTVDVPEIAGRKLSLTHVGGAVIPPPPAGVDQDFGTVFDDAISPVTLGTTPSNPNPVTIEVDASLSGDGGYFFNSGGGTQSIPPFSTGTPIEVGFGGAGQTAGRKNATLTFVYSSGGSPFSTQTFELTGAVDVTPRAQIHLDDTELLAEETTPGTTSALQLTFDHPYAGSIDAFVDQLPEAFPLARGQTYVLASGFGGDRGSSLIARRRRVLAAYEVQGLAADSRERLTEALNLVGQSWLHQTQLQSDLVATLTGQRFIEHHRFGIVGQDDGYFVDVKAQVQTSSDRRIATEPGAFQSSQLFASAMEHAVLEQIPGSTSGALSTIKILSLANAAGQRIYRLTPSNFNTLQANLSNYDLGMLAGRLSSPGTNNRLVLPEDGAITLNSWTGEGFLDYRYVGAQRSLAMIIGGGLMGGFNSEYGPLDPWAVGNGGDPFAGNPGDSWSPWGADPVDLRRGAFVSQVTDLELPGEGPRGLSLVRSYDSQRVTEDPAGLGRGWTHAYDVRVVEHTDTASGLLTRTAEDAAAMIVASHATRSLLEADDPDVQRWAVAALIAQWALDQLEDNAASVRMGHTVLTFLRQPDGSWTAPPGLTQTLTRPGGLFELRERYGNVLAFDADGQLASLTDTDGNVASLAWTSERVSQVTDSWGRTLTFGYTGGALTSVADSTGRSLAFQQTDGDLTGVTSLENAQWTYGYDALHRMTSVTDPTGVGIVSNVYDDLDRVVEQQTPRETGPVTYRLHYAERLSSEEDPNGRRNTYRYDAAGRTIAIEDTLGFVARTEYDGQGQVVRTIDPLGNETTHTYDAAGNRTSTTNALSQTTTLAYDAQDRLIAVIDPLLHQAEIGYDAENHPITKRDGEGNTSTTAYRLDGLVATHTDPRSIPTTFTYDAYGNPSSSQTGSQPAISMNHDVRGRLQSLTDQAGSTTSFTYDDRGLPIQRTDALDRISTWAYDDLGRLVSSTDRNGQTTTRSYTDSGFLDAIVYPDHTVSFTYDAVDDLVSMTDAIGTTTQVYDDLGRLTSRTDANGYTVGYEYDGASRLARLVYPGGASVAYTYDALGRIDRVTLEWLSLDTTADYDAGGRLTSLDHFNGSRSVYSYDDADRLVGIIHSADGQDLAGFVYQLDPNGNRTQATIDPEPALPAALIDATQTHAFNAERNRLLSTTDGGGTVPYTYDLEGQTQSKGATGLVFDTAHRLAAVGTTTYAYDGLGQRLRATRDGVTTRYVYDANGNLLAEADGAGVLTRYYVHGFGLLAMVDALTDEVYVYHYDGTGHTVAMTDGARQIVNAYAYDPFGRLMGVDETVPQPFTFVGQFGIQREPEGLYYMRARHYDADTGRFLSPDPLDYQGGANLYAYAGGNPIRNIDPTGEIAWGLVFGAVDLGLQLWSNGGDLGSVNWASVGFSMVGGGIVNGALKGAFRFKTVGSHTWGATRSWMNSRGIMTLRSGQHRHHWLFERNQGIGRFVPDAIKNQPWNINPISARFNIWLGSRPALAPLGGPSWAGEIVIGGGLAAFGPSK